MENKGVILICDLDDDHLETVRSGLENEGLSLEVLHDAAELVPRAVRSHPSMIIVNPDMNAYHAYDVCKHLIKSLDIPVIYMLDQHSTTRNQADECTVDEVVTKPVEIRNLLHLIETHLAIST
ncbi:response regulator [Paraflavisolibacter sp. H34]|uniref:response regulator n=1 Tax=Huijunlia imazamoxiresistens TaxID=3127457 RepID=UPI00301835D8